MHGGTTGITVSLHAGNGCLTRWTGARCTNQHEGGPGKGRDTGKIGQVAAAPKGGYLASGAMV